jgi:hypothetical protein
MAVPMLSHAEADGLASEAQGPSDGHRAASRPDRGGANHDAAVGAPGLWRQLVALRRSAKTFSRNLKRPWGVAIILGTSKMGWITWLKS